MPSPALATSPQSLLDDDTFRSDPSTINVDLMRARTTQECIKAVESDASPRQAEEDSDTFVVTLEKSDTLRYGIAYRVIGQSEVIITGVIPNSAAFAWNSECELTHIICAGDTIVSVNNQERAKAMVEEMMNRKIIVINVMKTGPRWHIVYDGPRAQRGSPRLPHSPRDKSPRQQAVGTGGFSKDAEDMQDTADEESLRWHQYFLIFLSIIIPNIAVLSFFSDVGAGLKVYSFLFKDGRNNQGNAFVCLGTFFGVVFYVFDWSKWQKRWARVLASFSIVYIICLGAFLKSRFYPYFPLVIVIFHMPVANGFFRSFKFNNVKRPSFYLGVSVNMLVCAFFMLGVWLAWMNVESWDGLHRWNDDTKLQLVQDSQEMYDDVKVKVSGRERAVNYFWDCDPDWKQPADYVMINALRYYEADWVASNSTLTSEEKGDLAAHCARVKTIWFLVWISPLMCAGIDFLLALFCILNGVLLNVHDTSRLEKVLKQFILMISFLVFTMYVSTSVAGASMRLTGVILAFCAAGLVALFVWLYIEIGQKAITSTVRNSKLMQSLVALATSDWVRAMLVIGLNVLIPSFLGINMVNQKVRKMRGLEKGDQLFTNGVHKTICAAKYWNWASIFIKVNWLLILYWTVSIGVAKWTYVFLSWLNETLKKVDFVIVLVSFSLIGFTMFMLPPVPGIPVYITSGIVLSARARNIEGVGFWGGTVIAVFLSLVIKICAVCGQYWIGHQLGKSVKVQQLIAVDKVFTRAIEKVLQTRGLNLPKVSVLVGGPDWPTSVLCGILKLDLFQCCLGTLPVIFVSSPCVIAGAFMSNPGSDEDDRQLSEQDTTWPPSASRTGEMWATLSTAALAFSFLVQLAGLVLALYFIQEAVHKNGEELAKPRKEHEAVAALTAQEAEYVKIYNRTLDWGELEWSRKPLILGSTCMMLLSFFIFLMMDEACFRQFQVSSKISDPYDENGLNGNVLNLVMMLGWGATGLFLVACLLHFAFLKWAGAEAKHRLAEEEMARHNKSDEGTGSRSSQNCGWESARGPIKPPTKRSSTGSRECNEEELRHDSKESSGRRPSKESGARRPSKASGARRPSKASGARRPGETSDA